MRSVAKFKLVHLHATAGLFDQVETSLRAWFDAKVEQDDAGAYRMRRGGRSVKATISRDDIEDSQILKVFVTEDIPGGELTTQAMLLGIATEVRFVADLGVVATGVSRPTVALRAPRFIQDVLALGTTWQIDDARDRVFSHSFAVAGHNFEQFKELILSDERALPVVAITKIDGHTEFPTLASDLAKRVSGLAHVCVLDEDASWSLTETLGVQWSCYNGAVRIYWPGGVGRDVPFRHTLWRADRVLAKHGSVDAAQEWLNDTITRRIIEASSYTSNDQTFERLEERRANSRIEAATKRAADDADYQQLANVYAEENDTLKGRLKTLQAQLENAEAELSGFRARYYSGTSGTDAAEAETEETEAPPSNVKEAVDRAKELFGNNLAFADNIGDSVATLSTTAGPPGKIWDYLSALNELSIALNAGNGNIGKTIPIWLRERGIECSGESETVKNSRGGVRTFRIGGNSVPCELHLKPSDGTSPDKCVRIYFAPSQVKPHIGVGYVGRHF